VALGEYRFLAGEALRAQDLPLAETLINDFLSVPPDSVPLLELNGELCEQQNDHAAAAQQYAKAVELLLVYPEPGMEGLHEELFEKVRLLSPDAGFVDRLAAKMKGEPVAAVELPAAPAAPAPDYEAHFTLGVAYKNMALYSEAREEFEIARTGDAFCLDSHLMIALCYKEEGHVLQAIRELEAVLSNSRAQGAKGQAIRYELGLLYEAAEEWAKAAVTFQSIPSFHDVPTRLAAIKSRSQSSTAQLRLAS
jgi:tetratricopeptide (TPR) repeat protein